MLLAETCPVHAAASGLRRAVSLPGTRARGSEAARSDWQSPLACGMAAMGSGAMVVCERGRSCWEFPIRGTGATTGEYVVICDVGVLGKF